MDQRGRSRDPDEDGKRLVAGGEGKRHELTLVAELGNEDHSEAQQQGVH